MDPHRLAHAPYAAQEAFLIEAVAADALAMTVLERARAMDLPDHGLMAGAVYQSVWNALTGRDPGYGINDYDLGYYDASDLGEAAEDVVIKAGDAVFADLDAIVEIRNQARVHLWFGAKHGVTRAPLVSTRDAVSNTRNSPEAGFQELTFNLLAKKQFSPTGCQIFSSISPQVYGDMRHAQLVWLIVVN